MSKLKYLLSFSLLFVFITIFTIPINTKALESTDSTVQNRYQNYDYIITGYDINIDVNENNTLDITENIHTYFNEARHGLYRTIPLSNTVKRLDGKTTRNRVEITNLKVSDPYTTSRENGNLKIQIGDPNNTIIGDKDYVISYTYNLGKDPIKDYDELYYNIIGTDWETVIDNITFTINMPKKFNERKLGFSYGKEGSTDYHNIYYELEGNTIKGEFVGVLRPNEALTVRLELEEGYFVNAGINNGIVGKIIVILLLLSFAGISAFLWYKYGRDDEVIETVEFNPPDNMNSLEVAFNYYGKASQTDVISLLIYLANKGYIEIIETEEKSLFSKKNSFKIKKLKEYDGKDKNEKLFLEGLFTPKETLNDILLGDADKKKEKLEEVTPDDLYDNFYKTINKILYNVNTSTRINKLFDKKATSKTWLIVLMIIISFFMITIPPMYEYGRTNDEIIISFIFTTVGFSIFFLSLFTAKTVNKGAKIFFSLWGLGFAGIPFIGFLLPSLLVSIPYLIIYIIGIISIGTMIFFGKVLKKRTPYGNKVLGKVKGFKTFLETAEKDKLEALVNENPTYFYDILPYAYVLDVTDVWMKKFENIALESPDWYSGTRPFNIVTFNSFMTSTMSQASSSMSSSSSSGGGSSGGGSGGGGGGSW